MKAERPSGEIYSRNDGLRILDYLGLLNDNLADYVNNYFSSMASGPDLLAATRTFYSSTIIQLVQTGEFLPDQEDAKDPAVESRAYRFDTAVKERLEPLFEDGLKLGSILGKVKLPKYIPEDREEDKEASQDK